MKEQKIRPHGKLKINPEQHTAYFNKLLRQTIGENPVYLLNTLSVTLIRKDAKPEKVIRSLLLTIEHIRLAADIEYSKDLFERLFG